ncbi:MAG: cytochrome c [Candidatus Tumulicola sp.]
MKRRAAALLLAACTLAGCAREGASAQASREQAGNPGSSSDGGRIYLTNCSSCHQADGRGVPGAFPALAGNRAVTGDPRRPIVAVKFGLRGQRPAWGLGGEMPAWNGLLGDAEIADVVTYIRFAWRNGAPPVSEAQVRAVKAPQSGR